MELQLAALVCPQEVSRCHVPLTAPLAQISSRASVVRNTWICICRVTGLVMLDRL